MEEGEHFGFSWKCYGAIAFDKMDGDPDNVCYNKKLPKEDAEIHMCDEKFARDYSIRFLVLRE